MRLDFSLLLPLLQLYNSLMLGSTSFRRDQPCRVYTLMVASSSVKDGVSTSSKTNRVIIISSIWTISRHTQRSMWLLCGSISALSFQELLYLPAVGATHTARLISIPLCMLLIPTLHTCNRKVSISWKLKSYPDTQKLRWILLL